MKITPPPQVNDKFELTYEEVAGAITQWIEGVTGRKVEPETLRIHLTTGNRFTGSGELKPETR